MTRRCVAIGAKDLAPRGVHPPIRIARFAPAPLEDGVETHVIDATPVRVFNVLKTIADCFRHRRTVGLGIAIAGLQAALRQRKATPADIARQAERSGGATVIRPYLEAFTADARRACEPDLACGPAFRRPGLAAASGAASA